MLASGATRSFYLAVISGGVCHQAETKMTIRYVGDTYDYFIVHAVSYEGVAACHLYLKDLEVLFCTTHKYYFLSMNINGLHGMPTK